MAESFQEDDIRDMNALRRAIKQAFRKACRGGAPNIRAVALNVAAEGSRSGRCADTRTHGPGSRVLLGTCAAEPGCRRPARVDSGAHSS